LIFFLKIDNNIFMEGLTISEMAEILGMTAPAVKQRLFVAKIKPITKEALYDKSALETISNAPGKGRPKKATEQDIPANDKNPQKPKK